MNIDPKTAHDPYIAQAEIVDALRVYLKGLRHADIALLRQYFHENAMITHVTATGVDVMTLETFLGLVKDAHSLGDLIETHVDPIIRECGQLASVHVPYHLPIGPNVSVGTVIFSFARVGGAWKCIYKIYSD